MSDSADYEVESSKGKSITSPQTRNKESRRKHIHGPMHRSKDSGAFANSLTIKELLVLQEKLMLQESKVKVLDERLEREKRQTVQLEGEVKLKSKGLEESREREKKIQSEFNALRQEMGKLIEQNQNLQKKCLSLEKELQGQMREHSRLTNEVKRLTESEKQIESTYLRKIDEVKTNYELMLKGSTNRDEKKEVLIDAVHFDPFHSELLGNLTFTAKEAYQDSPLLPDDLHRSIRIDESFTVDMKEHLMERSSKLREQLMSLFKSHRGLYQSYNETRSLCKELEKINSEKESVIAGLKTFVVNLTKQLNEAIESKESAFKQILMIRQSIENRLLHNEFNQKSKAGASNDSDDLNSLVVSDDRRPKPRLTRNNTDLALKDIADNVRMYNNPKTFNKNITARALGKEESRDNRTSNYKERDDARMMTDNLQKIKMRENLKLTVRRSENVNGDKNCEVADFFKDFNQRSTYQAKSVPRTLSRPRSFQSFENERASKDQVDIVKEEHVSVLDENPIDFKRNRNRFRINQPSINSDDPLGDEDRDELLRALNELKTMTKSKLKIKNSTIKAYRRLVHNMFGALNEINLKIKAGKIESLNLEHAIQDDIMPGIGEKNYRVIWESINNFQNILLMIEKAVKRLSAKRDVECLSKLLSPVLNSSYYADKIRSNIEEDIERVKNLMNDDSKIEQGFKDIRKLEDRIHNIINRTINSNKETGMSRSALDPFQTVRQVDRLKEEETLKQRVKSMIASYFSRLHIDSDAASMMTAEAFSGRVQELQKKIKQNSQEIFNQINTFVNSRSGMIQFNKQDLQECMQIFYNQTKNRIAIEEECWTVFLGRFRQIGSEVI